MPHRAIVVEDDEILRSVIIEALALVGIKGTEFSNADSALAFLPLEEPLSLVVTDVQMPGTNDGLDLAQHIWDTMPALPVILIFGNAVVADGMLPPNAIFLRKPFSVDALHDAVAGLMPA